MSHFDDAVEAERAAPLCPVCEEEDIYQRSPENCVECGKLRLTAALPHLRRMLAEELRAECAKRHIWPQSAKAWNAAIDHLTRTEVMK